MDSKLHISLKKYKRLYNAMGGRPLEPTINRLDEYAQYRIYKQCCRQLGGGGPTFNYKKTIQN